MVHLEVHPNPESAAQALAAFLTGRLERADRSTGRSTISLCGGSTPARLYEIAGRSWRDQPWSRRLQIYWGDERFVPPTSAQSNYRLAAETLLAGGWFDPTHVHPVPTQSSPTPDFAAQEYEAVLHTSFPARSSTLDVALMGIGPDGHTASLFPGQPSLREPTRWALPVPNSPLPPLVARVTLTLPFLNRSRTVVVFATGAEKASIVRQALAPVCEGESPLPVTRVQGTEETIWFLDAVAAGAVPR
ncbi:MAG: 6-phosphogluconolactonase [Thermoplasmata archaeon]|nr:6-phosphogluconolactonase [Thermoplasmata archaeon]